MVKPFRKIEWPGRICLDDLRAQYRDIRDEFFWATYDKWRSETLIPPDRMYASYNALRTALTNDMPGDIVECGVFRGGSFCFFMDVAIQAAISPRRFWAYDTFDGFPDNTSDTLVDGTNFSRELWHTDDFFHLFQRNLDQSSYDPGLIRIVRGSVIDTIPVQQPEQIAFLHLDTDYYEATKHQLVHLYDLVTAGACISVDDYGHFEGCRRAVDEYVSDLAQKPLMLRSDYSGRLIVKP